jgi:hypothetical protein
MPVQSAPLRFSTTAQPISRARPSEAPNSGTARRQEGFHSGAPAT